MEALNFQKPEFHRDAHSRAYWVRANLENRVKAYNATKGGEDGTGIIPAQTATTRELWPL